MTHDDGNDPFPVRPDRRIRSDKPVDAPPPAGPRFEGAPPVPGIPTGKTVPDMAAYVGQSPGMDMPPGGFVTERFSRTWAVSRKRWGMAWLAFLIVATVFGLVLGSSYPSPDPTIGDGAVPYYLGAFIGFAMVYQVLFGWWLDHVLAGAGWIVSLVVQSVVCGGMGLMTASDPESEIVMSYGFPPAFFGLAGLLGIALAHTFTRKIDGSFETPRDESYVPPSGEL